MNVQLVLQQVLQTLAAPLPSHPSAPFPAGQQPSTSQTQQQSSSGSISAGTTRSGSAPVIPLRQGSTRQRTAPKWTEAYNIEASETSECASISQATTYNSVG
jgi:hypothetical protein